ncbi:MAG: hypothetical protein ACYCPH_01175 [Minisyncoccota bacterium]
MAKNIDFPPQRKQGDSGAEKPTGVPVVITHRMHEELKNLGLSIEERRRLTPQAAWDILKSGRRPETGPEAASPSEAPVAPEPESLAPEEPDEHLAEAPQEGIVRLRKEIADLESRAAHPGQGGWKENLEPDILKREEELRALETLLRPPEKLYPEAPLIADPARALDSERVREASAPETNYRDNEGTPLEWRERLRELITGAKERMGTNERAEGMRAYLSERSGNLDKEAETYGPKAEKLIRSIGARYSKLHWKYKIAIGAALGVSAAIFSGISTPLALLFGAGIATQRGAAMASVFLKFEKHLQDTGEGKSQNFFARQEWYKKIAEKPEQQRKLAAAIMSAAYTVGASLAIGEAIHLASESAWGDAVHEWLKQHWPLDSGAPAAAPPHSPAAPEAAKPSFIAAHSVPEAPAHAPPETVHGAAGASPAPEMPTVSVAASEGHGYEYMMKRLWEQLQAEHLDPSRYPQDSDIHRLLTADAHSIDTVVHQIAADPKHGFFHADGTSVLIDPHAHMTIGSGGEINLSDAGHDLTWAPTHLPTTPAYHPEAPAGAEPPAVIPEVPVLSAEPALPMETLSVQNIPFAEHAHLAITPSVTNHFGLEVPLTEPHIYTGPDAKHLFVFGGTPATQADSIQHYLSEHPKDIVYGTDATDSYRVPYYLGPDGKVTAGLPVRTRGLLGFFSSWMKAPRPEDFKKIIQ